MSYGNNKESTEDQFEEIYKDILNIVNNNIEYKESNFPTEKKRESKLYLNKVINILINKPRDFFRNKKQKTLGKYLNWWRKETTSDIKGLTKFIVIHGLLGITAFTSLLTITNLDITLIQLIREKIWLTIIIYFLGTGSTYYLLIDINKALSETWGRRNNKK